MRILGIDPGLQRTGYGLIDVARGAAALVEAGVVRADARKSLEARLAEIYDGIRGAIRELRPDVVAVEDLFSTYSHPKTAILMGHARGVIFLAAAEAGVPVRSYAPNRVKQAVTNSGHADKRQVQRAVQTAFRLPKPPQPADVADALAIALCHWRMAGRTVAAVRHAKGGKAGS